MPAAQDAMLTRLIAICGTQPSSAADLSVLLRSLYRQGQMKAQRQMSWDDMHRMCVYFDRALQPRRWKATPVNLEQWKAWFKEQADLAGAKIDKGLYVSLRLDGRVRGSGLGPPPWQRLIAQLPKAEGEHEVTLLDPSTRLATYAG